jgi:hypothetical protein
MRVAPPVLAGWHKINRDDVVREGDKYWSFAFQEWRPCKTSVGRPMKESFTDGDEVVIRKGAPQPAADKEWLNPWD